MHILEIGPDSGSEVSDVGVLYKELASAATLNVGLYTTHVQAGDFNDWIETFELATTSKDLFLGLGKLTENGRLLLCFELERAFEKNPFDKILFRVHLAGDPEDKFRGTMVVSRMCDSAAVFFHCSPAR